MVIPENLPQEETSPIYEVVEGWAAVQLELLTSAEGVVAWD